MKGKHPLVAMLSGRKVRVRVWTAGAVSGQSGWRTSWENALNLLGLEASEAGIQSALALLQILHV